jgi:hypothetical protein
MLTSEGKQKKQKCAAIWFLLAMNKSLGKRASVIPSFKIHVDKRGKTKKTKNAQ